MAHSYNLQIVSYNLKLAICCIQHYGVITKNRLNDDNDDERKIINEGKENYKDRYPFFKLGVLSIRLARRKRW